MEAAAPAGGDGTSAKPFRRIGDARAILAVGDTIWVRSGTYDEVLNFWSIPGTSAPGVRTWIAAPPGHAPKLKPGKGFKPTWPDRIRAGAITRAPGGSPGRRDTAR